MMGFIADALRETFFSVIFDGGEVDIDFHKILVHSVKRGGLYIPDPRSSVKSTYNTSKADRGKLVHFILVGTALNYIVHRACLRGSNAGARKELKYLNMAEIDIQKELPVVQ